LTVAVLVVFSACDSAEETQTTFCQPDENVFCRCPGGDSGTHACNSDGSAFGQCEIAPGVPCGDRYECNPGDKVFCVCPNGTSGEKECLRDGTSYGECRIDASTVCPDNGSSSSSSSSSSSGTGGGGTGGSGPGCTHDVCETGDPLGPDCDFCTAAVCAADDYCCTTKWDLFCLTVVDQECGGLCSGPTECVHDPCEPGDALDPLCDPCVDSVCAVDDFCCGAGGGYWDAGCVTSASDVLAHPDCAGVCGCDHDECTVGIKLDAACSECATAVCGLDAFCCETEWDDYCVMKAEDEPICGCPS
jgi:hypothetical protein